MNLVMVHSGPGKVAGKCTGLGRRDGRSVGPSPNRCIVPYPQPANDSVEGSQVRCPECVKTDRETFEQTSGLRIAGRHEWENLIAVGLRLFLAAGFLQAVESRRLTGNLLRRRVGDQVGGSTQTTVFRRHRVVN